MWAFSLTNDSNAGLGCVDNENFKVLSQLVSNSERVGYSASHPDIKYHIQATSNFWRKIIATQPTLLAQANAIDNGAQEAARDGFEAGFNNGSGDIINKGYSGGFRAFIGALSNLGPMMNLFRPHVAKYAPEALQLARREQELDRFFNYRHPSSEALQINIQYLEAIVLGYDN